MPGYEQERAYRADRLREACLSEDAIRLIVDSQDRSRAAALASTEWRGIDEELAQAAHADPLDLGRLERALALRAQYQADQQARRDREAIALLRRLPPRDRAIYSRHLSVMSVFPPPPRCTTPWRR